MRGRQEHTNMLLGDVTMKALFPNIGLFKIDGNYLVFETS
jgi:hypothetical protein